jgi:hypothetical protein
MPLRSWLASDEASHISGAAVPVTGGQPGDRSCPWTFTKNRDRLLEEEIAAKFFHAVLGQPQISVLLSDDHFTVDGTLIEAFASLKSVRPRADPGDAPPAGVGRNAERDFHGERRGDAAHASRTDPEARLLRKGRGKEARLCFISHLLMEDRRGLIVDALLSEASGVAERDAALTMLGRQAGRHRITLGADILDPPIGPGHRRLERRPVRQQPHSSTAC